MFRLLTLCLKLAIYAGALTTVVAGAVFGPEITTELGFPGTSPAIAYGIGGVIGIFSAAILFGIPIVLLKTMQPVRNESRLVESLAPIFADHALDALESD